MHQHLYPVRLYSKQPFGFYYLKALVHHRGAVDGNLCPHVPGRVMQRMVFGHGGKLFGRECAERSTRSREQNLFNLVVALSHNALEYSRVFAVYRQDRGVVLCSEFADQFSCHNESFLVGKTNLLVCLYSLYRRT